MDTLLRSDGSQQQPTLLLADDSITIQRVIALTFIDEGIRVVAVNDGTQAIRVLDQNPPDIVLVDVGIAAPDGYEVARYIKETPRLAHIPVLLSAGAFEPVDHLKAEEIGCAGVLGKPFEPQRVIARVKELLAQGARQGGAIDPPLSSPSSAPWDTVPDLSLGARTQSETSGDIDDYFDRLDKAFALLSDASTAAEPPARVAKASVLKSEPSLGTVVKPDPPSVASFKVDSSSISIFKPEPEPTPKVDAERSAVPSKPDPPLPPPPEWTFVPARVVEPVLPARTSMPSLADAFATLLAAEQSEDARLGIAEWPSLAGAAPVPVPDDLVDQVTTRVLERVSDRVVRETVGATAERMIRDEIERIKANIT